MPLAHSRSTYDIVQILVALLLIQLSGGNNCGHDSLQSNYNFGDGKQGDSANCGAYKNNCEFDCRSPLTLYDLNTNFDQGPAFRNTVPSSKAQQTGKQVANNLSKLLPLRSANTPLTERNTPATISAQLHNASTNRSMHWVKKDFTSNKGEPLHLISLTGLMRSLDAAMFAQLLLQSRSHNAFLVNNLTEITAVATLT